MRIVRVFILLFMLVLSACVLEPQIALTATPDPCTGWDCNLRGTLYLNAAADNNRASGAVVNLLHTSHCSPTRGKHQAQTDTQGNFSFDVFLHDTDSFLITVEKDGYQTSEVLFGGFDCLSCHCQPLEIVLVPE